MIAAGFPFNSLTTALRLMKAQVVAFKKFNVESSLRNSDAMENERFVFAQ